MYSTEMLATEPILLLMSLFIALIYGLLVRPSSLSNCLTVNYFSPVRLVLFLPCCLRPGLPLE